MNWRKGAHERTEETSNSSLHNEEDKMPPSSRGCESTFARYTDEAMRRRGQAVDHRQS